MQKGVYGKTGAKDPEVIDGYLARLPDPTTVLNLGCGPYMDVLYNLGHSLVLHRRQHCTLILADVSDEGVRRIRNLLIPGRLTLVPKRVNAFYASRSLGLASIDLVLALGLFGALTDCPRTKIAPSGDPDQSALYKRVLRECWKILRPGGLLVISNSSQRQPRDLFLLLTEATGYNLEHTHESPAIYGVQGPDDLRYLLVLRKQET